jgi:cytochrome c556
MNLKISYPGPLACGVLLASAIAAFGHGGATGVVGERMMGMMMLSEQVKLLGPIAGAPTASDLDTVLSASEMIAMHAGPAMTELFPEGSLEAPTEAKPEIWQRWQEFERYAERLGALGEELGLAAEEMAAPVAVVVEAAASAPEPKPIRSEWELMDFAALMGISTRPPALIDPQITASVPPATNAAAPPAIRPVGEIYADITATCSSCHAAFRR